MNPKLVKLLYEGFSITTLENMSNEQLNLIYKKVVEEQASATSTTPTKNIKATNKPAIVAAQAKGGGDLGLWAGHGLCAGGLAKPLSCTAPACAGGVGLWDDHCRHGDDLGAKPAL